MLKAVEFWLAAPPAWLEIAGYVLVALVGAQMLVGYRKYPGQPARFRQLHFGFGWAMAALMGLHAVVGVLHSVAGYLLSKGGQVEGAIINSLGVSGHVGIHVGASIGNWPLWLDINGLLLVGLFTVQALAGYRVIRMPRRQFVALHSTVAWLIVITASLHAVLATVHLLLG